MPHFLMPDPETYGDVYRRAIKHALKYLKTKEARRVVARYALKYSDPEERFIQVCRRGLEINIWNAGNCPEKGMVDVYLPDRIIKSLEKAGW